MASFILLSKARGRWVHDMALVIKRQKMVLVLFLGDPRLKAKYLWRNLNNGLHKHYPYFLYITDVSFLYPIEVLENIVVNMNISWSWGRGVGTYP